MITSPEVRAVNKRAQLARLAAKGTPEYPELYAKQPAQIRLRAEKTAVRKAEREARIALILAGAKEAEEAASMFENSGAMEVK